MGTGDKDKREAGVAHTGEGEGKKVLDKALHYMYTILSRKDYTERELRDKLKKHGYEEVMEEVIDILKREGYIDDRGYAERFIRDCINIKRKGPLWVRYQLIRKGVSEEMVEELISLYREMFKNLIKDILPDVRRRYEGLPKFESKRKVVQYLLNRGFYYEDIKEVLNVEP